MMGVKTLHKVLLTGLLSGVGLTVGGVSASAQTEDVRQTFPQVETTTPTGVNLQTGQFTERGVDMQFGPFSVDHFARYAFYDGGAGDASKPSPYATSLLGSVRDGSYWRDPKKLVQIGEMQISFEVTPSGTFFPKDSGARGWRMVASGSDYLATNKSGTSYRFAPHAALPAGQMVLSRKIEADKHQLDYTYTSSGQIKLIESSRGFALVFAYGSGTVTVCGYNTTQTSVSASSGCGSSDMKVTYGVSGEKLVSITDPEGHTVSLVYSGDKLTCVTLPDSSTCRISNTYSPGPGVNGAIANRDQVLSQTTATGETWQFSHIPVESHPEDYTPYPGEMRESYAHILAPDAFDTYAKFENGFVTEIRTTDTGTQLYEYSTDNLIQLIWKDHIEYYYFHLYPKKVTYPEGNSVEFARDFAGNVISRTENPKPGSGPSRQATWTYPTAFAWSESSICAAADVLCDKPTKVTDYNGNETDFVYNSTYGGLLSKTLPPDENGVRPQTRYSYAKKYAWIKSGSGYVQAPTGVWLLVREEYCRTSAATNVTVYANRVSGDCAAGSTDEVVTTYEYEAGSSTKGSNLLLLGTAVTSEGVTLRSCVTYDEYGRKIAETKPLGTSGSCQ